MDELWVLRSSRFNFFAPPTYQHYGCVLLANIEWSPPFWVSFHLLQVGANGIAPPNITHHTFSCKLKPTTLLPRNILLHTVMGLCASWRSFRTQAIARCFCSNLLCSTLQQNIMCKEDLLAHWDHCYNILAFSLPFYNLLLDMSCVSISRLLKDCEYVRIKMHGTHLRDL